MLTGYNWLWSRFRNFCPARVCRNLLKNKQYTNSYYIKFSCAIKVILLYIQYYLCFSFEFLLVHLFASHVNSLFICFSKTSYKTGLLFLECKYFFGKSVKLLQFFSNLEHSKWIYPQQNVLYNTDSTCEWNHRLK